MNAHINRQTLSTIMQGVGRHSSFYHPTELQNFKGNSSAGALNTSGYTEKLAF